MVYYVTLINQIYVILCIYDNVLFIFSKLLIWNMIYDFTMIGTDILPPIIYTYFSNACVS